MTKTLRYMTLLLVIIFLAGCATTRDVLYDKTERQAKPDAYYVEIYNAAGVHRPYKVIGIAIAGTGPFHHVIDAIEHLQDKAKEMGGDALIDLAPGLPQGTPMPEGGWFILGSHGEIWSARVIIWE